MGDPARERSSCTREPGAAFGLAVLLAWMVLVATGFQVLVAAPLRATLAAGVDPEAAAPFERWAAGLEPGGPSTPRVYVSPQACPCRTGSIDALRARLMRSDVAVRTAPGGLPGAAEVAAFDAAGRLRYAGPVHPALFCLGDRSPAELLLHGESGAALVLPVDCACPVDTGSS